jgi:hypothetical protein
MSKSSSQSRNGYDYPSMCRALAAWLMDESKGTHRALKRGETADRLLEMAALLTASEKQPSKEESERLDAYRAALVNLCQQNGGRIIVTTPELTPPGSLLWRWVPEGLEFRFHKDGEPQ